MILRKFGWAAKGDKGNKGGKGDQSMPHGLKFLALTSVMRRFKTISERLKGRCAAYVIPFLVITFLWTSCSDEQLFPGNARIKTTFRLTSPNALGGSITIQQAYLKLEGISVTGTRADKSAPEATYPISLEDPPYRLTQGDTAQISLTLPTPVYDKMDLHLLLLQTEYQLIVHQKTTGETPPPIDNDNGQPTGGETDPTGGNGNDSATGGEEDGNGGDQDDEESDDRDDDQDEDSGDRDDDEQDEAKDDDDDDHGKNNDDGDKKNKKDKDKDDDGDRDDNDDRDEDEDKDDDDKDKDDDDGDDDRRAGNNVTGTVDLDHFFQHAKPSLVVFATWTFNGQNINVVLAVTEEERITIRATQNDEPRIMVNEHGRGTVNFNPERWFESISTADLQNASVQDYQGQPVMFIHKDVNTPLFEILLNNIKSSTAFDIDKPAVQ